jgi:AcrR family transcriptional regulator
LSREAKARLESRRRVQILDAAARVFARKGFDRATVTEVARAARLAEGSIYNYFHSKEDLLVQIPRHLALPAWTLLENLPVPSTAEELEAMLHRVLATAVERMRGNAQFFKLFVSVVGHLSPKARETFYQVMPATAASIRLERILGEGIRRGYLRQDLNPVLAARLLPGMLVFTVGLAELLLGRRAVPYDDDEIISEAVRVFLYGTVQGSRSGRSLAPARGKEART